MACSSNASIQANQTQPASTKLQLLHVHMQVTRLKFTPEHARSYNELVEVIERNLLLADWHDEDHVESLLSCRTSKYGDPRPQMLPASQQPFSLGRSCDAAACPSQQTLSPSLHWCWRMSDGTCLCRAGTQPKMI